ncbi:uracil phosphoribosyltransferase [Lunatimonas salinarum]|uniref:uracil phosphoribosyltransferase n=1 Tax=Lunatimonas salinarum TaxID=1774590 RepID=UPI001ADF7240|nr:uracil phosphoribosyltransferase [Lunatimonas salinarum]
MFVLNRDNSIANHYLAELRNTETQTNRLVFRKNLERLGQIMAYEISKELTYETSTIKTPLAETKIPLAASPPVVIAVLRAAIPYFNGVLSVFDNADSGLIGAFRKDHLEHQPIEIELGYLAAPSIEGKDVILVDPMLATGKSFVKSINALLKHGRPTTFHLLSVIAAPEGVEYLQKSLKSPFKIWTCALDDRLDSHSYIIPGLGDAGDLCFGPKLSF